MRKQLLCFVIVVTCLFICACSVEKEEIKIGKGSLFLSKSEEKAKAYKTEIDDKTEKLGKLSFDFENKMFNKQSEKGEYTIKGNTKAEKEMMTRIGEIEAINADVIKQLLFMKVEIGKDEGLTKKQKELLIQYIEQHSMYFLYISEYANVVERYLKDIIDERQLFTEEEKLIKELLDYRGYIIDFDIEIKRKILHENVTHPYRDSEE